MATENKNKTTIRVIRADKKSERAVKAKKVSDDKGSKVKLDRAGKKLDIKAAKLAKKAKRAEKKANRKPAPKFVLAITKPFRALGAYLKASWKELKQVRWTNRRTTWKLTLAVIVYCILFAVVITALDVLFQFIFNRALA